MFIKICGITNEQDALLATAVGADAVGFVFAVSARQVRVDEVHDILHRLPPEVVTVGVFRNERPERVVEIASKLGLTGVQLHGREPLSEVRFVRDRVGFVIQAFSAGDHALTTAAESAADVILVDSPDPGSGRVFDWRLAEGAPRGKRLMLAGGLRHDNVAEAIQRVRPWGVDVSTGVEASPGRKNIEKVRLFVEAARAAGELLAADGEHSDAVVDLTAPDDAGGSGRPFDWQIDLD